MCPVAVKNPPDFPVAPVPSSMGIHAVTYELSKLFTIIPNTGIEINFFNHKQNIACSFKNYKQNSVFFFFNLMFWFYLQSSYKPKKKIADYEEIKHEYLS